MNILQIGAIGGLVGGVVFGVMMGMMRMLPMVAKLFGSESAAVGFVVHLVFSSIIGVIFVTVLPYAGVAVADLSQWVPALGYGLVYGFTWWILGGLIIMPVWLGMSPQLSGEGIKKGLPSLLGHLVYGALLGLTVSVLI